MGEQYRRSEKYPIRHDLNRPDKLPTSAIGVIAGTLGMGMLASINRGDLLANAQTLNYEMYVLASLAKPIAKAMDIVRKVPEIVYTMTPLEEVLATKRNYNIEVKHSFGKPDQIDLVPHKEGSEPVSLNYLLPEGYKFQNYHEFACDRRKKIVYVPFDSLKYRVGLFGTLHEIAHANKELPTEAEDERYASLFAIQAIRNLQKMGFDTFADFDKRSDIFQAVKHGLYSHEAMRKLRLYSQGKSITSSVFTRKKPTPEHKNPLTQVSDLMNIFLQLSTFK
jgi:hypothetical protein